MPVSIRKPCAPSPHCPAVERVALAALVPMDGSNSQTTIRIAEGRSPISTSPDINVVGAGYFALLDIPVKQGREFTAADRDSSPPVAVVNETMARQFWNGDPVGQTFTGEDTGEQFQIVGVVRDLRHRSFGEEPMPMVYFCAAQRLRRRMTLHVRTAVAAARRRPPRCRTGPARDRSRGGSHARGDHERVLRSRDAAAAARRRRRHGDRCRGAGACGDGALRRHCVRRVAAQARDRPADGAWRLAPIGDCAHHA